MNGRRVTQKEIQTIIRLRKTGHSLPEIRHFIKRGNSTVFKYIKGIKILSKYQKIWKIKQGGSTARAKEKWKQSEQIANQLIKKIDKQGKLLIAACLYWAEGTKKDLSLSNTDSILIKSFILCLEEMGVQKKDLKITIRIYEDLNKNECITYWSNILGVPKTQILNINILKGKKVGKLKYGMCRIRVTKGEKYFKLLQSLIKVIGNRLINSL